MQDIPCPYVEMFHKQIPEEVCFALPNGKLIFGYFSKNDRKFFGMNDFGNDFQLDQYDLLLFTHWGIGQFDVVIFSRLGVEKLMKKIVSDDGKYFLL